MKIIMTDNRILAVRKVAAEQVRNGIIVPAKNRNNRADIYATVIAVADNVKNIKVGDVVISEAFDGVYMSDVFGKVSDAKEMNGYILEKNDEVIVLNAQKILAIVENEDDVV